MSKRLNISFKPSSLEVSSWLAAQRYTAFEKVLFLLKPIKDATLPSGKAISGQFISFCASSEDGRQASCFSSSQEMNFTPGLLTPMSLMACMSTGLGSWRLSYSTTNCESPKGRWPQRHS